MAADDRVAASYDAVPYVGAPATTSHPIGLATIGTLLGMTPPPVERCRVLELGCADGANLIPIALTLPHAEVVGIDLSPRQIEDGRRTIAALGLTNVRLDVGSITDVDAALGTFDYVVCHGVFSWVPRPVQEAIFAICARQLAPQGLAYVSFNVYPGWHRRGMVRDMMGWHVRRFTAPEEKVAQARALIEYLAGASPEPEGSHCRILTEELDVLRAMDDSYVFHEHLEDVNDPVWFADLAARARAHGLQYVAESTLAATAPGALPIARVDVLSQLAADVVEFEQYFDFVRGRTFRRSVFCHADVALARPVDRTAVRWLLVASAAEATGPGSQLDTDAPAEFRTPGGRSITVGHPAAKAALVVLGERWPAALSFDAVGRAAAAKLGTRAIDDDALATALVETHRLGAVDLMVAPGPVATALSDRPRASPLARLQVRASDRVTSLRHKIVQVAGLDRAILPLLDGAHDHADVVQSLVGQLGDGSLTLRHHGGPVQAPEHARDLLQGEVTRAMERLLRSTLLWA